jgi:hypothetical protein
VYYQGEGEPGTVFLYTMYMDVYDFPWTEYSAVSWTNFQTALENAKKIIDNPADATEEDVGHAISALQKSLLGLHQTLHGDIDRDGQVTVSDVVSLRGMIVEGLTYPNETVLCDLDGDVAATVSDVVELRKLIVAGVPEEDGRIA